MPVNSLSKKNSLLRWVTDLLIKQVVVHNTIAKLWENINRYDFWLTYLSILLSSLWTVKSVTCLSCFYNSLASKTKQYNFKYILKPFLYLLRLDSRVVQWSDATVSVWVWWILSKKEMKWGCCNECLLRELGSGWESWAVLNERAVSAASGGRASPG